ncbi:MULTISPECIES: ABC transporter permease [unclassified Variovorax]|uniref:ABC transporter permease n=1 Tax=unclassified Variovorax TaxID=663243 RepID=UPI00076CED97|nr:MULTISPECIES: ABC transporter permease [unclassified Variovorax]KWT74901.1 binding-protein-dependent transport systems inner membrane component [Variovorax sp. WDL1]PNG47431.1 Bicarbonate transport system permease protein CmpB [Variovorax sp. B2]PNG47918.1 Bicarbonate transport system permease protein CmpB [Variovorax sp. B4]VTV15343.1 Bicarbonate transport system permease protein CmpB [Variovorax sp. WDL1]
MKQTGLARFAASIGPIIALVLLWWIATGPAGWIDAARFPDPAAFLGSLRQISLDGYAGGDLAKHVVTSTWLVVRGFALAMVLGIGIGLAVSLSAFWRDFLMPIFNFLRPVPPLAWIPLALLWFGLGDASKLFVMAMAASIPLVINTATGVEQIDRTLLAAARVNGARGWTWLRHVILPGAMPHMAIGLRLALQTSWTVIVAAELLGAIWGVGKVLTAGKDDVYPGMILVGMVTVAVLGMLSSLLLTWAERWVMPWRKR